MSYSKEELRKIIRQRKRQFTSEQLRKLSLDICNRILNHEKVKEAKTIVLYYSLDDEVFTHDIIDFLNEQGKLIILPVVIDNEHMILREYHSINDLKEGCFHISEPIGKEFTDYERIDIALIPGMSFDKSGNRLGRGKGYYDRFLQLIPNVYKIGVCFDFQKEEYLETEVTDIPMNEVI
nr:5-formyltetrahydrofolate cyclo-ligase [Prevotella sp.]